LSGEAGADRLRELVVAQSCELVVAQSWRGAPKLTVDVSGLRSADLASVRVLAVAGALLWEEGGSLVLLNPQPQVARLLSMVGADQAIVVRDRPQPGLFGGMIQSS
jgi:anti-anti-sigma factor